MDTGLGPLGILAGNGDLPLEVANAVRAQGRDVHLVAIRGEADPGIEQHPHTWVGLGEIGRMLRAFRDAGCQEIVILGGVQRPDLRTLHPDLGFFLNLPLILSLMAGGDDSVLRRVLRFFQHRGFRVLGAHEVAPQLVAPVGVLAGAEPDATLLQDVATGLALIRALGPSDVGQAVVIADGRPVAIEAAEGTDRMLARLAEQREKGFGGTGGVLVKAPKPGQELRIDLPAVGPQTADGAARAGLAGIAIAAGQVLVAKRAELEHRVVKAGLFLLGAANPADEAFAVTRGSHRDQPLERLYGEPTRRDFADARRALAAAEAVHPFGAGKAIVVARQHVLAVEAGEGAGAAVARVRDLRQWGDQSSRRRRGLVLLRDEMPAPEQVIERAAGAGLAGLLLTGQWSEGAQRAVVEAAQTRKLFVLAGKGHQQSRETNSLRVFLVAGEHSGDALGARLMSALKQNLGERVRFAGVGGERMREQGLTSLFPLSDVAVMGPLSILRRLPRIVRRVYATVDAAIAERPDVVVIIDSPEFTHPIARRIRRRCPQIPIIDYVSPSVWAWRPGRAKRMRRYVDHVLALLPFEPEAHRKLGGPPCTYVGHPLIERREWLEALDPAPFAERLGLERDQPVLVVLPGSRSSEVERLMQPFGDTVRLLHARGLVRQVIIPVVPHVRGMIEQATAAWPVRPHLIEGEEDKFRAFKLATAALAASGTVTLELALIGTPAVVAYRVDPVAARLRFLVKVPSIVLANLVLGENVYPEFVQDDCTPEKLAAAVAPLLSTTPERRRQLELLARVPERMAVEAANPSHAAAEIVLRYARAP